MNPLIASLICAAGITGLLYLDRENTLRTSRALWLPGIWIASVGSRPMSEWLGIAPSGNWQLEGSPVDAAVFGILLVIAIGVLIRRRKQAQILLRANWPIVIYFLYCLISVAWSYHLDIAFKRWIKALGDVAIALIIVTDNEPTAAIRRLVSRIGMLLFPTSVLLIRYYGDLGRRYSAEGLLMNTGVTTNKNSIGLIVFVISLVVLWNVRWLWIHKAEPSRGRRLLAQCTLLALGLWLLWLANCSTCKACFALGGFLILALNSPIFRSRPARVHVLCLVLLVAASLTLLTGGQADVANALGRESSMSGRTDIWAAVIPAVPNAIVGAGFESFWISPNVPAFQRTLLNLGWYPPLVETLNEAHNGYIEVYLNLGWIGICLMALVLIEGYRRAMKMYRRQPELASLFLAYIATALLYNITESGFRMLNPSWIFLILAILGSSGITAGFVQTEKSRIPASRLPAESRAAAFGELVPESEPMRVEFI